MRRFRAVLLFTIMILGLSAAVGMTTRPRRHVLLIGIDGCRFDALVAANTPRLRGLIANGAFARRVALRAPGHTESHTVSGPGWNTILSGLWPHQHGTFSNTFPPPATSLDVFTRIRRARPASFTASFADWAPINRYFARADHAPPAADPEPDYARADERLASAFTATLARRAPDLAFLYFGQVDEEGHRGGFDTANPGYRAALARVDALVGDALDAVEARRRDRGEAWLVLVTTDHGGQGRCHDFLDHVPAELDSFVILEGDGVERGAIAGPVGLIDVTPTVLAYLDVPRDPALPGRPLALR